MKFSTLFAIAALLTRSQDIGVKADSKQPPLQTRVHLGMWKKSLLARDQEVLRAFEDMAMFDVEHDKFSQTTASLKPAKGDFDNFDFDIHLAQDYLGAESDNLVIEGKGIYDGSHFTFKLPVTQGKVRYALDSVENKDLGHEMKMLKYQEHVFSTDNSQFAVSGVTLSEDDNAALLKEIDMITNSRVQDLREGNKEVVAKNFPMDAAAPFVALYYAT